MLDVAGAEIAQNLRDVLIGYLFARFDLNDEAIFDEQIRFEMADYGAILIPYVYGMLLLHLQPGFMQSVRQTVFIHLFQMTRFQIAVQSKTGLSDLITQ